MKICSVNNCDKKAIALGLCSKHWLRQHKTGTTDPNRWAKCVWEKEELDILRAEYPIGGTARVHELLPHRTEAATKAKAHELGIRWAGTPIGHTKYAVGISGQNDVLMMVHRRAKRRGNELLISDEEIIRLSQLPCHYCGTEKASVAGKGWGAFKYNGIDRLDNDKGYVPGNVVPCCGTCNRMKMAMPYDEFLKQIKVIAEHTLEMGSVESRSYASGFQSES